MRSRKKPPSESGKVMESLLRVTQAAPESLPENGWDLSVEYILRGVAEGRPDMTHTPEEWNAIFIAKLYPPHLVPEITTRVQQARSDAANSRRKWR